MYNFVLNLFAINTNKYMVKSSISSHYSLTLKQQICMCSYANDVHSFAKDVLWKCILRRVLLLWWKL